METCSTLIQKIHSVQRESHKWPRSHGLDPEKVLERIHVARAYNTAHQMLLAEEIKRLSRGLNVKMIIVDSLTSHFRAEFIRERHACK